MNEKEIQELSGRLQISTAIDHPDIVAANKALNEHQNRCRTCNAISKWIADEFAAGRILDIADRDRIGVYIIKNSCTEGLWLYTEVGRVMMVHPDQSHR